MSLVDAAVVGDEEDMGVLIEAFRLQEFNHPADLYVPILNGLDVFRRHPGKFVSGMVGMDRI